ncbi:MAG: hypothetical protein K2X46_06870 [Roseomonas sp.]|nr:hypothetical protein [Roseomonas sp.]
MTGWVQIAPRRGKRPEPKVGVTIALRLKAGSPHSLSLTFRAGLVEGLGWKQKEHVTIARNADGTKLLFARATKTDETFAIHGSKGSTCLYVNFGIGASRGMDGHAAEDTAHEMTPDGVVVSMPVWATVAMGFPEPPPPPLPKPADPKGFPALAKAPWHWSKAVEFPGIDAADLAEARDMMRRASVGATRLAEYFGWQPDLAVQIAAALRDDLAAEARRKVA